MRSAMLLTTATAAFIGLSAVPAARAQATTGTAVVPSERSNSTARPIAFADRVTAGGALVLMTATDAMPTLPAGVALDSAAQAAVASAIKAADFTGKKGETLSLRGIGAWSHILVVGTGPLDGDTRIIALRNAAGTAAGALRKEAQPVTIALSPSAALSADDATQVALGYALGQYRFDRYKSGNKAPPAQPATIVGAARGAESLWTSRYQALAEATAMARDLGWEPANMLYPESFVAQARAAFAGVADVSIEVLDEAAMKKANMGSILGVGQGSRRPPRMLAIRYTGAGNGAPLALVGKGITFDSGGTSIKPGLGMWEMKSDMSGAATVVATVLSLARSKAPVNVVAVAALAENMPGGNAQRPGDVVRTMSGKTIEVLNTDAEGRLVLADAVEYAANQFKPSAIVTVATLTGAVVRALDDEYAGLFANDDTIAAAVAGSGARNGEDVWRLPLHPNYADDMKSDIADIKNVVENGGPGAGLGAHFIGHFIAPGMRWAHIDIAGVNWMSKGSPTVPAGATGWGVRLLDDMARNWKP